MKYSLSYNSQKRDSVMKYRIHIYHGRIYHERKNILSDTYTNQSIANKRETSLTGASMALRTTNNRTSAALGTEADETEAAVDVRLRKTR